MCATVHGLVGKGWNRGSGVRGSGLWGSGLSGSGVRGSGVRGSGVRGRVGHITVRMFPFKSN